MNLLLDTHVFLCWLQDPSLLSIEARQAITDGRNAVYLSAAVVWEIAIKKNLGKLEAPDDSEDVISMNRFIHLPINIHHALTVTTLPDHHRDPFDRILVAQARYEGLTLVSRDPYVPLYGGSCIIA
jgi:PIN domain nuclease of toxin-antitoxin system